MSLITHSGSSFKRCAAFVQPSLPSFRSVAMQVWFEGVHIPLESLPGCMRLNASFGPTHELWFATTRKQWTAAQSVGYLTPDKKKENKGWWAYWYLGLREDPMQAATRLQQIKAAAKELFVKEDCVLVRCTFTEIGIGYYAMRQQTEAPFLPYLSKETYPWDIKTDWGVWYFRGEMLPLIGLHPESKHPLVVCEAFDIF